MTSKHSAKHVAVVSAPIITPPHLALNSQTKLHEEDGWIFSERPGIGVTCLCRSGELPPPHVSRQNHPSEC
jgi:hypothetical protein